MKWSRSKIKKKMVLERKGWSYQMIVRKKARKQSDVDSEDEHKKCLKIVTFESILDSEIIEKKLVIARLNKVSSPDGDYLVIYRANGNFRAFNYLMEVLHIFDRQDLFHLYDLIRDQFLEVTLDGFELILWGDLKIMMESSIEGNEQSDFWSGQQDWKIVTWRLYESCGVCILGKVLRMECLFHMLGEAAEIYSFRDSHVFDTVIMEYLVKISKKARILELKQRYLKITVLTTNTPYPSRKIRRICACTHQRPRRKQDPIRRIQKKAIRRIQAIWK
ncbi:hypothetical protein Tco_1144136 [Tanacetum coccineum]